jgi:hypothetical protein
VPAKDLKVLVFDPAHQPQPKRVPPARPPSLTVTNAPVPTNTVVGTNVAVRTNTIAGTNASTGTNATAGTNTATASPPKPKFSKQQVAGRLRELKLLFEEGMLTDTFYDEKVTECEAAQ